jgi:hypothetical protein
MPPSTGERLVPPQTLAGLAQCQKHLAAAGGEEASHLIPKIRNVINNYKFRAFGDYIAWPGPNPNTFVQAVLDAVPGLKVVLPPTAIGKDYPYEGVTASRTGGFISLGGYLGLTIGRRTIFMAHT